MSGGDVSAEMVAETVVALVASERDGFAALLGAFHRRALAEAERSGVYDAHLLAVRIGEMVHAVGKGLHLRAVDEGETA